jgi:hypothetical protein
VGYFFEKKDFIAIFAIVYKRPEYTSFPTWPFFEQDSITACPPLMIHPRFFLFPQFTENGKRYNNINKSRKKPYKSIINLNQHSLTTP